MPETLLHPHFCMPHRLLKNKLLRVIYLHSSSVSFAQRRSH
jgi:hypothetical protein